ncbi:MAG: hypothetical protein NC394_08960 [Bacteroides sp.]|nr:hypothetical protein [Bacteroides sp.]
MKADKLLPTADAVLIPAPLMITSLASVYKDNLLLPLMLWWAAGVVVMLLGGLTGSLVDRAGKRTVYFARIAAAAGGAVSAVGCIFFLYLTQMTSLAYMLMPAAFVFWYWLGHKAGLGREVVTNSVLLAFCLEAAFLYPMCNSVSENSASGNIIVILSAAVLVVSAVLINRRQLVKMSSRGKNKTAALSKDTRRFNLKLTLIFSAAIIIPFFFARWGGRLLLELLRILVQFLLSLFVYKNTVDNTSDEDIAIGQLFEANENMWAQLIAYIIAAIGLILIIKPLINAIKALIEAIRKKLGMLSEKRADGLAYVDFYEASGVESRVKNSFKKAYKAFLREKEPCRRYRLGYRAFMIRLKELGEENLPYDTTTVHREKEKKLFDYAFAREIIDKYERLRYSDTEATAEDCAEMERMLKTIAKAR